MPYPQGPYSRFTSLPVPPRPKLAEAREIDFTALRYVTDPDTGGFSHMPAVAQRVVILSLRVQKPEFNTAPLRDQYKKGIESAVQPLLTSNPPVVEDLVVVVSSPSPGKMASFVRFRDVSNHRRPVEVQLP